jgi:2-methylisocitrate lyase-like PEP mutase family enzyme
MVALVAQITRATTLPISVDLETGYGRTAPDVADSVTAIVEAGAVGVNLEDGAPDDPAALLAAEEVAERIAAAVEAAQRLHVPIVVNGRTDMYWRQSGPPEDRFAETVRRLRLYADAGAHCVFAPGFPGPAGSAGITAESQRAVIRELVHELGDTPLNLLTDPTLPPVAELRTLGVRRLSTGSALYRLGLSAVRDAVTGLLRSGSLESLKGAQGLGYPELADALARSAVAAGRIPV